MWRLAISSGRFHNTLIASIPFQVLGLSCSLYVYRLQLSSCLDEMSQLYRVWV